MAERSARGRHWRRPTGRMMAKTARRVADSAQKKEEGRWQLVANRLYITGHGSTPVQGSIEYRMDAGLPCNLYNMNLVAAVTLVPDSAGTSFDDPVLGVIAITKLRQGESVQTVAGKTMIALAASTTNVTENQRRWRAWMPFMLLSSKQSSSGTPGGDTDWRMSPVHLPLRGNHRLLYGERLAILLALPGGARQNGRVITLNVWGRFRYLVDAQYPSLSGPECGEVVHQDPDHAIP